ncbi:MAG: hypothetical protein JW947_10705 [Sedimentisphaerales bacterium]|nr:hypothetical protein [Sedimentisphaerales bacterium]
MARLSKENHLQLLLVVGLLSWLLPGAGYFVLEEKKRAIIIFVTISLTLCIGLYAGSIGVIDMAGPAPFYVKAAQAVNPPIVLVLSHYTAGGGYPVYGWPNEIGQIYTMVSGLLNLLCIISAVSMAHLGGTENKAAEVIKCR